MRARPRRYTMVTSSAPSFFDCTAASIAVMPPPITTTRRPTGRPARSGDWRSSAMNATAGRTPAAVPPFASSAFTPPRPMPRKTAS